MSTVTSTASVATSGSTSYVQSTASGLDTDALVDAAVAQKTAAADTIDARIDANKTKIAAYQELQTLLDDLAESLEVLAAPVYSSIADGNEFDTKAVTVTAASGSDAEGAIAAGVDSDAVAGSYQIEVVQLAKTMKVAGETVTGNAALDLSGVITIAAEGSSAVNVTVTSTMSVQDVAAAIAATSATSGVTATAIRAGDGVYRLVISGLATGAGLSVSAASGDDVLAALGVTDESGSFADVLQEAQSAVIVVDGATIESQSNEIDDVIPGVSLSLLTDSAGDTLTLTVAADHSAIKTAVTDFISAYNAVRTFLTDQQSVGADGVVADDAVLFADSGLRSLTAALAATIASPRSSGTVTTLSALGITLTADNTLSLSDENALDNAILGESAAVEAFFETSFVSSDSNLKLLRNDTTKSLSFTLSISVDDDGKMVEVTANGETDMFTVEGNRIVGVAGTAYDGLSFALVTSASLSIDVEITQGFANLVATIANAYGDDGGVLQASIDQLTDTDTTLQTRADKIREDAESYRNRLLGKYSDMETKVQAAKLLQQQIEAILNSSDDNS